MFNVLTLVETLRKIGEAIPNINTCILGDIYELNSLPDIDYSVFAVVQDTHRADEDSFIFGFYLYYIDRLLNDGSNRLEIQSHGIQLLTTVIDKLDELGLIINPDNDRVFQTFHQRFSDECAGVYARIEIQVLKDCQINYPILVNPLLADLAVYQPGTYNPADYGADGFHIVSVSGESYDYYSESGNTASINNGKHSLTVDGNGVYIDGNEVTTNNVLSAYTYDKQATTQLIQAALGNFDEIAAQVSANSVSISTLSALTGDYVEKNPELHKGYAENIDFNDYVTTGYYVIESMSSASTENNPTDVYGNAILHVIALTKDDLDDVLQIFYTADDNTGNTDIYLRRRYWNSDEDEHYWGPWVLLSGSGGSGGQIDTQMDDNSTNAVENKTIKKYVDDKYITLITLLGNLRGEVEELKRQMSGQTSGQTVSGNVIYYTTHSGNKLDDIYWAETTDRTLISQTFENGQWKAVFDGDIYYLVGRGWQGITPEFETFIIPPTVNFIAREMFQGAIYLTQITIPDSVRGMDTRPFSGCTSLESITVGNGMNYIDMYFTLGAWSLTSVTFGSNVSSMSDIAFGTDSLKTPLLQTLVFNSATPPILTHNDHTVYGLPESGTVYAPIGSDYSSFMTKMPVGWSVQYI